MTSKMVELIHAAPDIQQKPCALNNGEMNPVIVERFFAFIEAEGLPKKVWEPFAGHTGKSVAQDIAQVMGVDLLSYDLAPTDSRVVAANSVEIGPMRKMGGVLFHPPYFGTKPMSDFPGEISSSDLDFEGYKQALGRCLSNAWPWLPVDGAVCAVGRVYTVRGAKINLPEIYEEIFTEFGFRLQLVWKSEPDLALIFRKGLRE